MIKINFKKKHESEVILKIRMYQSSSQILNYNLMNKKKIHIKTLEALKWIITIRTQLNKKHKIVHITESYLEGVKSLKKTLHLQYSLQIN